jgi:hypothetical protein
VTIAAGTALRSWQDETAPKRSAIAVVPPGRSAHDLGGAVAIGRRQDDGGAPHVFFCGALRSEMIASS